MEQPGPVGAPDWQQHAVIEEERTACMIDNVCPSNQDTTVDLVEIVCILVRQDLVSGITEGDAQAQIAGRHVADAIVAITHEAEEIASEEPVNAVTGAEADIGTLMDINAHRQMLRLRELRKEDRESVYGIHAGTIAVEGDGIFRLCHLVSVSYHLVPGGLFLPGRCV